MKFGCARVSTSDQDASLQRDALKAAGCEQITIDKVSGAAKKRPTPTASMPNRTRRSCEYGRPISPSPCLAREKWNQKSTTLGIPRFNLIGKHSK